MFFKKSRAKKAAERQMDALIMAVLFLIVVGAAVIVWQAWTIRSLESSNADAEALIASNTRYNAASAAAKDRLFLENRDLQARVERWNAASRFESPHVDLLEQALSTVVWPTADVLLGEYGIVSAGKIIDEARTPYSVVLIKEGQARNIGLFAVKRVGVGEANYELVPDTTFLVGAHQSIGKVEWTAPKTVTYEVVTQPETGDKQVEKKTLQLP